MRSSDWSSDVCSSDLNGRSESSRRWMKSALRWKISCSTNSPSMKWKHSGKASEETSNFMSKKALSLSVRVFLSRECQLARRKPALHLKERIIAIFARLPRHACFSWDDGVAGMASTVRSEEHTSELQSLMRISYAVFCLKKK